MLGEQLHVNKTGWRRENRKCQHFTKGRITGSRLALAIHLGLFAAAAPVYAAQPQAGTAQPVVLTFDIPAQSLGSAVLACADQAGLQVLFDSQRLQGLNSTALKGSFSVQEGLGRLLGAAPVEYRFTSERQVTLNRVSDDHAGAMTVRHHHHHRQHQWPGQ